MLTSWSHSALEVYEKCHQWAKFRYVEKRPDKKGPAAMRGTDVHDKCEKAVKESSALPPETAYFKKEFEQLQLLFRKGRVKLELERAWDTNWKPVPWKQGWGRAKYDARVLLGASELLIVDYKTGRKDGNEIKHSEQGQIYMLSEFMIEPEVQTIYTEFWYLDQNDLTRMKYTRDQGLRYFKSINGRAVKATSDSVLEPTPSKWACKWCPYRQDRGGPCQVGVVS